MTGHDRALRIYQFALIACVAVAIWVVFVEKAKGQEKSLREWFNSLSSPAGGQCCLNFDGASLDEAQWRTTPSGYQVVIDGKWVDVPDGNLVTVPNRLGRAHLWLRDDGSIRCFIPGPLS